MSSQPKGGADITTIPPGHVMRYGYVAFRDVDLLDVGGMFPEAMLKWVSRYRDVGDSKHQFVDCPFGRWEGDRFVIENGRHRFFAAVFQGYRHVLVRWLEEAVPPPRAGAGAAEERVLLEQQPCG